MEKFVGAGAEYNFIPAEVVHRLEAKIVTLSP
jgi:hypothetical protein